MKTKKYIHVDLFTEELFTESVETQHRFRKIEP